MCYASPFGKHGSIVRSASRSLVLFPIMSLHFFLLGLIFHTHPSLEFTQPLTSSTRNRLGDKRRPVRKAHIPTAISENIFYRNVEAAKSHNLMGLHGLLR
jgi:hypothetical protein